jgi:SAM-dependent methyltransferase
MPDPKQGEREYYARIGDVGRRHAARKPFSDEYCARYLVNYATILSLMRPPPARIVELGCGTGWLSLLLAERGYEVIGVDIAPEAVAIAEQLRQERQVATASFRAADYEEVRIEPPADYVVFHDALHHAESEVAALRAAHAALAPGGAVFCLEPGDGHAATEKSRQVVREFGVHEKDLPPRTIIRLARAAGFHRHLVLPVPDEMLRTYYRPGYAKATDNADLWGRKCLSALRGLRRFFATRAQGVVVLWRD